MTSKVNSAKLPYISVVITAYNRKEFLLDAIESALSQTLDKRFYEIIVIKNFKDNMIDDFIEKNNIKNILMDGSVGTFLRKGMEESSGDIISFLDDDDYFDQNKLERIFMKFKKEPDIVYIHNNQIIVNENKEFIRTNGPREARKINSSELLKRPLNIGSLIFNTSSISVKRDYYLRYITFLSDLKTHQDDFFLYCAMNESISIYFDSQYLTYYRSHSSVSNVKIEVKNINDLKLYREEKSRILEQYREANQYMLHCFSNSDLREIIMFRQMMENIELNFYTRSSFAKGDFKELVFIIKFSLRMGNIKITSGGITDNTSLHKIFLLLKHSYFSIFHFSNRSFVKYKITRILNKIP